MERTHVEHDHETPTDCARFDAHCGAFLERELSDEEHAWITQHQASCADCRALVKDLQSIIVEAQSLPGIAPSRDLWQDIDARLDTHVIPIGTAASTAASITHAPARVARSIPLRTFAIAAALLVAVTSGVTWRIAVSRMDTPATLVAGNNVPTTAPAPAATSDSGDVQGGDMIGLSVASPASSVAASSVAASSPTQSPSASTRLSGRAATRLVGDNPDAAESDAVYEREISSLRTIVDDRFAELDTTTVRELRRNLDIIDRAILDSKRALARDPRSALLATQLDRARETKLALLRRVALL